MLIIEKNEIYEKIKKEKENLKTLNFLAIFHITSSLLWSFISIKLLIEGLNESDKLFLISFITFLTSIMFLSFLIVEIIKTIKIIKKDTKVLNRIYHPENFKIISKELIRLNKEDKINLINKDLINEVLELKKEKIEMTENLKILKTVAQEIENN